MAYQKMDNSGSLFVNDRKEKDNHPDRQGSALIDGVEYWVSGWIKRQQDGSQWLSLAFKPKEARQEQRRPAPRPEQRRAPPPRQSSGSGFDDMTDDVPW